MSPSLDLYAVFAKVAESGSFAGAARDLGLSKATVSKRVAELEAALGVALLARTTRRAAVTEAGQRVLAHAQRIVEEAEAARDAAGDARSSPRGKLRLAAPLSLGARYLGALLPTFLQAFPEIDLDLRLSDRRVDIVGDGFDLALRISPMEESSLIARKLAPVQTHVVASAEYWRRVGKPSRPEDLAAHNALIYANGSPIWTFEKAGGEKVGVRPLARFAYDNADVIEPAICAGLGVARQPDFICWQDIANGRLETCLEDWRSPEMWLHLLSPPGRGLPRKARAFSDFIHDQLGGGRAPWVAGAKQGAR